MAVFAEVAVSAVVAQMAIFAVHAILAGLAVSAVFAIHAFLAVRAVSAVLAVYAVRAVDAVDAVDVAILIGDEVGGDCCSGVVRHGFFSYKVSGRSLAQMMDYTRKSSRKRSYNPL